VIVSISIFPRNMWLQIQSKRSTVGFPYHTNQPTTSGTPPVLVVCSHSQFMTQNSHNSRTSNSFGNPVTPQHLKWGQSSHKSCQITKGQDLAKKQASTTISLQVFIFSYCSWFMDDTNLVLSGYSMWTMVSFITNSWEV
jgi:hypothetical protein